MKKIPFMSLTFLVLALPLIISSYASAKIEIGNIQDDSIEITGVEIVSPLERDANLKMLKQLLKQELDQSPKNKGYLNALKRVDRLILENQMRWEYSSFTNSTGVTVETYSISIPEGYCQIDLMPDKSLECYGVDTEIPNQEVYGFVTIKPDAIKEPTRHQSTDIFENTTVKTIENKGYEVFDEKCIKVVKSKKGLPDDVKTELMKVLETK